MAENTEDLEIEIENAPETPAEGEIQVVKAEETPKPADKRIIEPEEGLEALRQKLEAEKQARLDADRRAQMAQESEVRAKTEVHDTNLSLLTNAVERLNSEKTYLKAQLSAAYQNQDFDAVADLQDQLSTKNAELVQIEQGKKQLELTPKPQIQRQAPSDPVEGFIARSNIQGRSADWIRQHPQFATDPRLTQKMVNAHGMATADGYIPDTPEYFAAIEDLLRIQPRQEAAPAPEPTSTASSPVGRRAAPPAAPVTRSGNSNGNGGNPNIVRLTAAEREMAQMMQMSDKEYAQHKLALQKEGLLQ